MDKVQLYAEITSFNHSITNDRETKSSKFYYMQDSEAAEKALFIGYITLNYPLGKQRFENVNTAIDLAFGSGNLCSKILIENNIVLKKLILNDKFSSDVNRNLKDAFESLYVGLECKVTDFDFFDSASFNEKADLLIFNPTSGGKPYSKDYNKNGKKEDLVQTIQNILTDESLVIFNGKRDEFGKLFSNLKCIFTYIPVNGNNEITIAYNNGSEAFHKVFHNEGEIKEVNYNESFYGKEVDLDTI